MEKCSIGVLQLLVFKISQAWLNLGIVSEISRQLSLPHLIIAWLIFDSKFAERDFFKKGFEDQLWVIYVFFSLISQ